MIVSGCVTFVNVSYVTFTVGLWNIQYITVKVIENVKHSEKCGTRESRGRSMYAGEVKSFSCGHSAYGNEVKIDLERFKPYRRELYLILCEVWVYATGMVELNTYITLIARCCLFLFIYNNNNK